MKKNKIFLFSAAALLALGLVGCTTEPAETGTTPTDTATQTETGTATQTSTATPLPVSVAITAEVTTFRAGDKVEFTVTVANSETAPTITVSDTTIAKIVKEGAKTYLEGLKAGEVTVTAAIGEVTATKKFTVKPAIGVTITAAADSVRIGQDVALTVTVTNNEDEAITVTSSDETKATVSVTEGNYKVHGVAAGTVTITLTCGNKTDTVDIEVTALPTIEVSTTHTDLIIGEELPLTIAVENTTADVTVESSDTTKATVSKKEDGKFYIKGIAEGPVTFTATVEETYTDTLTLDVKKEHTIAIAAAESATEVYIGDEVELQLTITENHRNLTPTVESSDITKATVTQRDNKFYAKGIAAGEVTFTATLGKKTATVKLNVVTLSVALSAKKDAVNIDEKQLLTVTVEHNRDELPVTVTSSDPTIAEVKLSGTNYYLYGYLPGQVTVTATVGELTATKNFTITNKTAASAITGFLNLITDSGELEADHLKDAVVEAKEVDADGKTTLHEVKTANIYNDNRYEIDVEDKLTAGHSLYKTVFMEGNNLVYLGNETKDGVTTNTKFNEIDKTGEIAAGERATKTIDYSLSASDQPSLAKHIKSEYLATSNFPKGYGIDTNVIELKKLSATEYQLKATGAYYKYFEVDANIKFYESGLLKSLTLTRNIFLKTVDNLKGAPQGVFTLSVAYNEGARVASPADALKKADLAITDYTPAINDNYGDPLETAKYYVGETYSVGASTLTPTFAAGDEITIKSISPADAATIDEYDATCFTINKQYEEITITATSGTNAIEKTITIKSENPYVRGLTFDFDTSLATGTSHGFYPTLGEHGGSESVIKDSLVYSVVGDPEGVSITKESWGTTSITATKAGTYTVKVTSPYLVDAGNQAVEVLVELTFEDPDFSRDLVRLMDTAKNVNMLDSTDEIIPDITVKLEKDATDAKEHTIIITLTSGEHTGTVKVGFTDAVVDDYGTVEVYMKLGEKTGDINISFLQFVVSDWGGYQQTDYILCTYSIAQAKSVTNTINYY